MTQATAGVTQIERTIDGMQYLALIAPLPDGHFRWSVAGNGFSVKAIADTEDEAQQMIERNFQAKEGALS